MRGSRGVDLIRVETIGDDVEDIAATARRLRGLVGSSGAVFTSGGIGATHDDVTYEALSSAYGALPLRSCRHGLGSSKGWQAPYKRVHSCLP